MPKSYISFSECRTWNDPNDYRHERYQREYIEGVKQEPSLSMTLGTIMHDALADPAYEWNKALLEIGQRRYRRNFRTILGKMTGRILPLREEKASRVVTLKNEVELFIKPDGMDLTPKVNGRTDRHLILLDDHKTFTEREDGREVWNQYIVRQHKQLMFYSFALFVLYHKPVLATINAMNLSRGTLQRYPVCFGPRDHEFIYDWIMQAVNGIKHAGLWDRRLSLRERTRRDTQDQLAI